MADLLRSDTGTILDDYLPRFDFEEVHGRWIDAAPEEAWHGLIEVRLVDLTITRPLVTLRGLTPTATRAQRPLITSGPVKLILLEENRHAVGGAISRPWRLSPPHREIGDMEDFLAFQEPGWARYLTSFELLPRDGGTLLRTITRVACTDARARRRFGWYWLLIRPGSGLIRRDLLATVGRLAN